MRRNVQKKLPDNFEELIGPTIQIKREVLKRTVETITRILELEDRTSPGVLK